MSWFAELFSGGISGIISGIGQGIVGPVFNYLGKKQDVTLDGFKTATGYDLDAFRVAADHELAMNSLRLQANQWWGPKLCYMLIAVPASIHIGLVYIDSSFTFGTGHYGNLGVAKLPSDYFNFEKMVAASLFVVTLVQQPISAVSAWLTRKK